ncbi:hypothetical protein J2S43_004499 [Catenuloplanes nepalensis]|uniref:Uncharacterized protein n=1 Tax=Catenuloplanes nepalensis TaxID=587533 RepID=A0ABT9MX14_9ACTN|nr:hypothetical protein [Catenuloplanes nepalensis]MDP9795987.1 hypothetical protein [Catenuloplanes nepalensis]
MDGLSVFLLWLAALTPPVALAIAGNRLTRRTPTEHAVAAYWSAGLALTVLAAPAVLAAAGPIAAVGSTVPAALGEALWLVMVAALTGAGLTFVTTLTLGAELLFLLHRPPPDPPADPKPGGTIARRPANAA